MTNDVDTRLAELLCARLCHEVVGPVGAINNGIELVRDADANMTDEALSLIERSGAVAAGRLQFYRQAYGTGGALAARSVADLQSLAEGLFSGSRHRVRWGGGNDVALAPHEARLVLNLLPICAEALPRGGDISVSAVGEPARLVVAAVCEGEGAGLPKPARAALAGDSPVASLTPRSVHAYYTGFLARAASAEVEVAAEAADGTVLRLRMPRG